MLTSSDISGLELAEIAYCSHVREPRHVHEQAHFYIVLEGECTEFYQDEVREYRRFTIGFLPPDHSHSLQYRETGVRWFRMNIQTNWLERLQQCCETPLHPVHSHGGLLTDLFLRLHKEYCYPDDVSQIVIHALALEMLAEVSRQRRLTDRNPPRWLIQARDFLEAHFAEQLRLTTIAETVNMHPVHLAREFRKHFSCTIGQYIRSRRVEYACRELAVSDVPLAEIAVAAGFSDQSHLSRILKRMTGRTPAGYRNISRKS